MILYTWWKKKSNIYKNWAIIICQQCKNSLHYRCISIKFSFKSIQKFKLVLKYFIYPMNHHLLNFYYLLIQVVVKISISKAMPIRWRSILRVMYLYEMDWTHMYICENNLYDMDWTHTYIYICENNHYLIKGFYNVRIVQLKNIYLYC